MEEDPQIGILGPRLIGPDEKPLISRFRTPTPLTEFLEGSGTDIFYRLLRRHVVAIKDNDESVEPGWIGFPCVMLRGAMVKEIGGLDERYFMYFEDVAYCRRAARAGWRLAQCRRSGVVHFCGKSSQVEENFDLKKRLPAYYYASRTRFYRDEYGLFGLPGGESSLVCGTSCELRAPLALREPTKVCEARAVDIWTSPEKGAPPMPCEGALWSRSCP